MKTISFALLLCAFLVSCAPSEVPDTRAADEALIRAADAEWSKAVGAKAIRES